MKENLICTGEHLHNSTLFAALLHMDWALMQSAHAAYLSPHHFSSLLKRNLTNMEKERSYQQE